MEVDGESEPNSGDVPGGAGGPSNSMQPRSEAFTPARIISLARCSGLGSWFLFSWFMQRKGTQRHEGGSMGCLRGAGRAVACVR